ncbi:ABC transporter ATP-binding protein [Paralimibaculum aggregatum]|uniref:ABC transporter ATP-binding protein n=1 Tax=Paralimibaculum aggregatum TaxID=3036245 RepID=UPI002552D0C3|nr:ABC transporter ATP-binding protein [Limibaculum sp. NKW23]
MPGGQPDGQPGEKPKPDLERQKRVLTRLFLENGLQHWKGYGVALAFMSVVAGMTGLSAWIMQDVINDIFIDRKPDMVWKIAGAVAGIFIIKGIASYVQQVILSRIGNRIVAEIQMRLFDHVQRHRIDFYEKMNTGQLAMRFSQNARSAREALNLVITSMGRDMFSLVALCIVMIVQDPLLAGIALLVGPPVAYGEWILVRKVKAVARAELLSIARIITTIQQTAQGARVVKAFGLEPVMRAEMDAAVQDVRQRADRIAQVGAATNPLMESFGGLAIAGVILYGGWRVIYGGGDPGAFFSFITALLMAYDPAKRLARLNIQLQASLVGVEMLYALLDRKPAIEEAEDAVPLKVGAGRVRLRNIRFRYGRKAPALDGLELIAEGGKVTALVGPSGAGKSTVFALIERFYDPDHGNVLIDGQNLRGVTFESLRRNIAYVAQDAFLFEGTVAENIRMGRLDATEEEIRAAAKAANAHAFIMAMPRGYETELGENGATLSGGERQRIAIARAMLRGAPILLLDEPTSALDAEAEAAVGEALARLMKGRTTIVIAHRLATVRHADMIHVIEGGKVVESGSHGELREAGGLYSRLYDLQFRD